MFVLFTFVCFLIWLSRWAMTKLGLSEYLMVLYLASTGRALRYSPTSSLCYILPGNTGSSSSSGTSIKPSITKHTLTSHWRILREHGV
jgi:hypothetical protein